MTVTSALAGLRGRFPRRGWRDDLSAGLVLGVESVPDGLASGVLAGVSPLAGLYGYLYGMAGAAAFTSTPFMAVQATGAMALIVADVNLGGYDDPSRALFTLTMMAGVVMLLAGVFRAGALMRWVPNSVMVGFITAVGVNIILGQLGNFTGYDAPGSNRVTSAFNLVVTFWNIQLASLVVGVLTVLLILALERTRLRTMGLVVAVLLGSVVAAGLGALDRVVPLVRDLSDVPNTLPWPTLPSVRDAPSLLLPALSLAFVGLVQGAGVSAGFPRKDGRLSDPSQDFIGQGAGNILAGLFRGMPVGGSMSASALVVAAGAKSRTALLFASGVMALCILLLADVVGLIAMPALAGLLIVVGYRSIKPAQVWSVFKTGQLQTTVMLITLVLTLLIPLQFAVLVGVALAVLLFVIEQSNSLVIRQVSLDEAGRVRETDPPATVEANSVTVLQSYGSLFFASSPVFEAQLPQVGEDTTNAVVIVRLRGMDRLSLSFVDVVRRLHDQLRRVDSKLVLVIGHREVLDQLRHQGLRRELGPENVYLGTELLGATLRQAHDDAWDWVARRQRA